MIHMMLHIGGRPLSAADILLRLTINLLDILADKQRQYQGSITHKTNFFVTSPMERFLTNLHGLLCCLPVPAQTSFDPLL